VKKLEDLGEFTLLSVEDDAFNQELAKATFDDIKNITIHHASDGEEGLKFVERHAHEIDIILLDLMMPNMSGFEFLEKIKSHPIHSVIPVIVVTSKSEEKTTTYKLGADDFLSKPYNPEELKLRVFNHIRVKKFYDLMHNIKDSTKTRNRGSRDNLCYLKEAVEVIDNSQKQLLNKLGNMAHESGFHSENASKRLGEYAKTLGQLYGLNSIESDNLYYSMSIYDIGLLRIPKEHLTTEHSRIFRRHPELGIEILEDIKETTLISMAKRVILYHHEAWDGTGYPYKMRGEEIPVCAQIAGIVDMFDKLTVPRIYTNRVIGSYEALEIIKRERGLMFNPDILDLFINNFEQFKKIKDRLS
jgi:putative two-component system response regulator